MENSLLLVDDEPDVSRSLSRLLKRDHYQIHIAKSGEDALNVLKCHPIKVVISDQRMPHMTGSQFLAQVKEKYPETIRIILSGYADFQALSDALNEGEIYKFLAKPWNSELLRADIREAFQLQKLRQHNKQLSHLFDSTIEAIVLSNTQGIIESVNPAFCELSQFSADEVIGKGVNEYFVSPLNQSLPEMLLAGKPGKEWHGELACRQRNGAKLPVWLSYTAIQGPYDDTHFAALFIDITDQKRKEARIEYQAYHDELTGLPNRRLFNDHLELALHHHRRNQQNLAVLFIDLDRFKQVNDTLGHQVGDELLIAVAERLKTVIRKGETLARFGGDEFIVVLPILKSIKECETVAEKIIACLKEPFVCRQQKIHIAPSIGISTPVTDGDNQDLLIRHADSAMYRAKALGGNNFQFFDEASNHHVKELFHVENALHEGISNHEFIVFYQAHANPNNGKICSCEALVRWQHPDKGILQPGSFIDVAEQTGLILPMGQSVLQQACEQLSQWRHRDKLECNLSVNLSARQFNNPNLLNDICKQISRYRIEPHWLEIEVTESILLNDMASSIDILSYLRDIGIRIALDDFGTGYSSLSYLQQLPIDTLKIDQSFIRELPNDKKSTIIIKALLSMAKGLGLTVVAEGVETAEQYEFLRNEGCDLIQGYFVSRPISSEEFTDLLQHNS
ncbi:MAG: EAL domain-containing protein [Pseudomonadales bacterium]